MGFSLGQRRGHGRNRSGGSQKERRTLSERARGTGTRQGAYLFFVASFSSHCRALKHKGIIKTCIWEAPGFAFKTRRSPRAEHSNERQLCFEASSGASSVPSLATGHCSLPRVLLPLQVFGSTPLQPLPDHVPCAVICFPGSRPPAGNEEARPSLNAGWKPCSAPCISCQKWPVSRSSQVKQWPLGHQVPLVRHYVLQLWARPHPLTALPAPF